MAQIVMIATSSESALLQVRFFQLCIVPTAKLGSCKQIHYYPLDQRKLIPMLNAQVTHKQQRFKN